MCQLCLYVFQAQASQTHRFMIIFFVWKLQKLLFVWFMNGGIEIFQNHQNFSENQLLQQKLFVLLLHIDFNEILEKPKTIGKPTEVKIPVRR